MIRTLHIAAVSALAMSVLTASSLANAELADDGMAGYRKAARQAAYQAAEFALCGVNTSEIREIIETAVACKASPYQRSEILSSFDGAERSRKERDAKDKVVCRRPLADAQRNQRSLISNLRIRTRC